MRIGKCRNPLFNRDDFNKERIIYLGKYLSVVAIPYLTGMISTLVKFPNEYRVVVESQSLI